MKNNEITEDNQSIYCYPGTNILINRYDIKNLEKLSKYEDMLVTGKLANLINGEEPFKRDLTIEHYLKLHEYLFAELYPFGGKLRQEFTNKKNSKVEGEEGVRIYCPPEHIYEQLDARLKLMKKLAVKVFTKNDLITFLAEQYMELYFIHPFRDGNSRTIREFLREYVILMNKYILRIKHYKLDYNILPVENRILFDKATVWNISSDEEKQKQSIEILKDVISQCLVEYEIEKQK